MSKNVYYEGVGRRKTSIARVRIYEGKSISTINNMPFNEYLKYDKQIADIMKPLNTIGMEDKIYFTAKVYGGGTTGQLEAIQLGIGRALYAMNPELKPELRKAGFVTRDSRMVERKKYHHVKARKKPQFSKR